MSSRGLDRAIRVASLIVALLATIAAIRWTRMQPFPLWWDEANYFNQVIDDRRAFLDGGPLAIIKSLLFADNQRPPAYRALVAPIAAVTLPSLTLLRSVSFFFLMVAAVLLWRACRTVAEGPTALLATALVFSMPEVLASGAWFGTEYPLFLAGALLLFSLLRDQPIGVAAAVALGLLSKSSFLLIGGPVLLVAVILSANRRAAGTLLAASACGTLFAAGWWYWDPVAALQFAQLGRTFEREAFVDASIIATFAARLRVLGIALGLSGLVALAVAAAGAFRPRETQLVGSWRAVLIGFSAIVPIFLLAAMSPVFVARHFAPALLGLALPLAVFLRQVRPTIRLALAAIALIQAVVMMLSPMSFLPRVERTDWSRLRALVQTPSPRLAFIGAWPSLSPPEICYGWTRDGRTASAEWLWRFEERRIDWPTVMRTALASDAVLVIPPEAAAGKSAREQADSQHTAEFVRRLQASGEFDRPVPFRIGTDESVDALVYQRLSRPNPRPFGQE